MLRTYTDATASRSVRLYLTHALFNDTSASGCQCGAIVGAMSYHFQPRMDSSDDEGVDLTAWKSGSAPNSKLAQPAASAAPMVSEELVTATEDDNEFGKMAGSQQRKKRKSQSPPAPSFQAINRSNRDSRQSSAASETRAPSIEELIFNIRTAPDPGSTTIEEGQEGTEDDDHTGSRQVIAKLPLDNLDRSEYQDFTSGADVVDRVLKEIEENDGEVCYKIQFADGDTKEVCCSCSTVTPSPIPLSLVVHVLPQLLDSSRHGVLSRGCLWSSLCGQTNISLDSIHRVTCNTQHVPIFLSSEDHHLPHHFIPFFQQSRPCGY